MKRRSFFSTIATAVAGFTILPPATTYARIWKAQRQPEWQRCILHIREQSEVPDLRFLWKPSDAYGEWKFICLASAPEIQRCIDNREKFVISRDIHPLSFPPPEQVWPSDNHKFCLTESYH